MIFGGIGWYHYFSEQVIGVRVQVSTCSSLSYQRLGKNPGSSWCCSLISTHFLSLLPLRLNMNQGRVREVRQPDVLSSQRGQMSAMAHLFTNY